MTADQLTEQFQTDIEDGGAVYRVPDLVDRFTNYSWIAVLPTGDVALARWKPTPEEEISLARENDHTIPEKTGLHMWKHVSPEEAATYFAERASSADRIGTIEVVGEKPHLDLDDPEAETHRPEAFRNPSP